MARGVGQVNNVTRNPHVNFDGAHGLLQSQDGSAIDNRLNVIQRVVVKLAVENIHLMVLGRVAQIDFHSETIELRLGQRIRSVVFNRILRGHHQERRWQRVSLSFNRSLMLAHGLQQT